MAVESCVGYLAPLGRLYFVGISVSTSARAVDLLLDGLTALLTDGYVAGVPTLRRALSASGGSRSGRATATARHTPDDEEDMTASTSTAGLAPAKAGSRTDWGRGLRAW